LGSPPFTARPDLTHVPLDDGDLAERLAALPTSAGVAQVLGPEGKNLLIGRAANLRRWAVSHLGAGRPPAKGKRPPTNLRPVATGVAYAVTTSPFQQKLVYERLMARHVPLEKRRDLKIPAFLHLDPAERFPRVSVRRLAESPRGLFGPFRDKKAAERARDAVHKAVPLRPCDYTFEPDPALPLGLGCLFAQVRSCAAPCLSRTSEADYRQMAAETASRLARGAAGFDWLPPWMAAAAGARGMVVDRARGRVLLYPVAEGRVLEAEAIVLDESDVDGAAARLRWDVGGEGPSDWPWLLGWLASPRGRGTYVALEDGEDRATLVARLLIPLAVTGSSRGGA
jgi:excinuclease ABC subunit C